MIILSCSYSLCDYDDHWLQAVEKRFVQHHLLEPLLEERKTLITFFNLIVLKSKFFYEKFRFLPKPIFFPAKYFKTLDLTKVEFLSSEIKVQKSVSMCKRSPEKALFFLAIETKKTPHTIWIPLIPFCGALQKKIILLLSLYVCLCLFCISLFLISHKNYMCFWNKKNLVLASR